MNMVYHKHLYMNLYFYRQLSQYSTDKRTSKQPIFDFTLDKVKNSNNISDKLLYSKDMPYLFQIDAL